IRDSRAGGEDIANGPRMGRQSLGNMDASRSSNPGRTTYPVANIPTFAAPLMQRMARRLSSPGKCGLTRRPSSSPKQKCTRTSVWRFLVTFRLTPSVLFLAALSRSTRWAASDMSAFRRCATFLPGPDHHCWWLESEGSHCPNQDGTVHAVGVDDLRQ